MKTDSDRLEEVKNKRPFEFVSCMASHGDLTQEDFDWLITEVESLRSQLAEAEKKNYWLSQNLRHG